MLKVVTMVISEYQAFWSPFLKAAVAQAMVKDRINVSLTLVVGRGTNANLAGPAHKIGPMWLADWPSTHSGIGTTCLGNGSKVSQRLLRAGILELETTISEI